MKRSPTALPKDKRLQPQKLLPGFPLSMLSNDASYQTGVLNWDQEKAFLVHKLKLMLPDGSEAVKKVAAKAWPAEFGRSLETNRSSA